MKESEAHVLELEHTMVKVNEDDGLKIRSQAEELLALANIYQFY